IHPFMQDRERVAACFGTVQSVAEQSKIDFSREKLKVYPKRYRNTAYPRYAHIDLGLTSDSAGVSIAHCPEFTKVSRGDFIEQLPIVECDLTLEIEPPKNGEIDFGEIRKILYVLRQTGLPIKWVSLDSF